LANSFAKTAPEKPAPTTKKRFIMCNLVYGLF
jgi:hypothetical protein